MSFSVFGLFHSENAYNAHIALYLYVAGGKEVLYVATLLFYCRKMPGLCVPGICFSAVVFRMTTFFFLFTNMMDIRLLKG